MQASDWYGLDMTGRNPYGWDACVLEISGRISVKSVESVVYHHKSILTESLPVEDDPQHDRRTNQCRDGVDGQVAFKRGQPRDEVAEQGQVHSEEGRSRDEQFVVAAAEQETRDVRHGQSQKGDRPAKRRDDGRQESRNQDDEHTAPPNVHAKVFGITLTQQQEIQGLE